MLLTRQDIAERLQVSLHKAGDYMLQMERVKLPGGRVRITEEAFNTWLKAHTERPLVAKKKGSVDWMAVLEGKEKAPA